MSDSIDVEVIYALPQAQDLVRLKLRAGSTVQQAVEASGLLRRHPDIDLARARLGIFGKISKADAPLRDRDRVEIYRPLLADPKEARKKRADEGKRPVKPVDGGGGDEAGAA